ncbi:MAG: hypothetical protein CML28_04490 [Rhizobiales bacterium]|nr:hypothetical protein [Hyphomicrobiales bacterium]
MKSYAKYLVVLLIFLGISPQDASTTTLYNNEYKLEMVVEVFHDLEFKKINNIKLFISHKKHSMNTDLEYRTYKKLFINELEALNYIIVNDPDEADFFFEFEYGINERVKYINYPVYKYTRKGGNVIYEKKRDNFSFRIKTKSPRKRILIGYKALKDITYHRYLNVDIFSSDNLLKVYQGKVESEGKINSLPYVMSGLVHGLFIDFPGNSSSINVYELSEDIYNPNAYQKRQNLNMERLLKRKN